MDSNNFYSLQTGLKWMDSETKPPGCSDEIIFDYPKPSTRNRNHRGEQSTYLYGTAPFMAQKGAPASLIDESDDLIPQDTSRFNRYYQTKPHDFPKQYDIDLPVKARSWDPASSRSDVHNEMFRRKYT